MVGATDLGEAPGHFLGAGNLYCRLGGVTDVSFKFSPLVLGGAKRPLSSFTFRDGAVFVFVGFRGVRGSVGAGYF